MTLPVISQLPGRARGRRWASCVVALLAAACWLVGGSPVKAAEAKAGATVSAPADHGHTHGPAGHPTPVKQFGYSYLTAFMFCLSLCLGSLFLVLLHHLFDSQWLVPLRRFLEHIACLLFPEMLILFVPILILAPQIFPWMNLDPRVDHALHAKQALFNKPAFYIVSIALFFIWGWLSHGLRRASLAQDQDGLAKHTFTARRYAAGGIFIFAFSLTLGAIYWMKSLQHQFFSTMYGVYYFAGSVWVTLATTYWLTLYFKNRGELRDVVSKKTFHDCGVLFFAFTVFYAYIHFSQYFLIWNAAIPEETFWYVAREKGSWWWVGQLIIFGHFFLPFLCLLRIDMKTNATVMSLFAGWAWINHYMDMQFNVMPALYPDGLTLTFWDLLCFGGLVGVLWFRFSSVFAQHPPYPQRDPRIAETMGVHVAPASGSKAAGH